MKFKAIATPAPSKGHVVKGPSLTVPNQSMSLQEILERFTRNEALPVGRNVSYHESDDDLEKVQHMDLVDREEFNEKLKQTKVRYEKQEREKARKQREKFEADEREKIRQELQKEKKGDPGPGKAD